MVYTINPDMAIDYLEFVKERHRVWERRQSEQHCHSDDPVINGFKFTNVFRVLDHGSQFVLSLLNEDIPFSEKVFRAFLYRYTNRPEPWITFRHTEGRYPKHIDAVNGRLLNYWGWYRREGHPVFGQAYKMFSGAENRGTDRLTWAVNLARDYATPVFSDLLLRKTMKQRHDMLKTIPRCADFMAMQINTDLGWTQELQQDENEWVVPGPGARVGAKHVSPDSRAEHVIEWAQRRIWEMEDSPALALPNGRLYLPSLMDVQNTFCEFGKYVRYRERGPVTKVYRPAHPGRQIPPTFPGHWEGQIEMKEPIA